MNKLIQELFKLITLYQELYNLRRKAILIYCGKIQRGFGDFNFWKNVEERNDNRIKRQKYPVIIRITIGVLVLITGIIFYIISKVKYLISLI